MKKLDKNSKTWKNLETAFAGESQTSIRYQYYASKAKKDGYEQISAIFDETSHNEKEHAKIWFKLLHDGAVPDTEKNLKDAAAGENCCPGGRNSCVSAGKNPEERAGGTAWAEA